MCPHLPNRKKDHKCEGFVQRLKELHIQVIWVILKWLFFLPTDASGGACNVAGVSSCDVVSTNCTSDNGAIQCICKNGFDNLHAGGLYCEGM